jgi:hypothetical protein
MEARTRIAQLDKLQARLDRVMPPTAPTYLSGEEVRAGDQVLYHGECGTIAFVAAPDNADTKWYVEQYGGGFMVIAASCGRVFRTATDEDIELLGRSGEVID